MNFVALLQSAKVFFREIQYIWSSASAPCMCHARLVYAAVRSLLPCLSLLKYFQKNPILPKPDGPLSSVAPSSSMAATNKEVKQVLDYPD